jgi:hypothetical protein
MYGMMFENRSMKKFLHVVQLSVSPERAEFRTDEKGN